MAISNKRKYRRRGNSKGKKAVVRKALRKASNKKIAKVCKRVVSSMIEHKQQIWTATVSPVNTLASSTGFVNTNVFCLTPNTSSYTIPQGTGEANRIGNVIKTTKCRMKIVLYPKPYSTVLNPSDSCRPLIVTFWCVSPKNKYLSPTDMAALYDTQFFNNGNSSQGYQSSLLDSVLPINTDVVTVHFKRQFKLGHSTTAPSPMNTTGSALDYNTSWSNNDFKMNHIINFDFTRWMPKRVPFNDGSDIPFCKTLYLLVSIAKADGTAYSSGSNYPLDMYYNLDYQYIDA